jgi:hypothetical protein
VTQYGEVTQGTLGCGVRRGKRPPVSSALPAVHSADLDLTCYYWGEGDGWDGRSGGPAPELVIATIHGPGVTWLGGCVRDGTIDYSSEVYGY